MASGRQQRQPVGASGAAGLSSIRLPLWLRFLLIIAVIVLAAAGGLFGYRYYTHPKTLTVAVGSIDGEAANAMQAIASRLVTNNAAVRLKVIDTGTALEAGKQFAAGKVDLAVVRGDVGDLSQAGAVVIVARLVALIIAPPGSSISSIDGLKNRVVGVIGGEANTKLVDVLCKEYGLVRAKVFKDVNLADARHALQSKEVSALLVVIPLSEKYLSLVRGFFQQGPKQLPVLIGIESAGAIAEAERAYESYDVPKGTLRGAPPVPDDDLTTLRTSLYLVANKKLGTDLVTTLTQTIMNVRRDLLVEQPIFAQIAAPSTDADAYLGLHPGAAAFYNFLTRRSRLVPTVASPRATAASEISTMVTPSPAAAQTWAMPLPMVPAPMMPTCSIIAFVLLNSPAARWRITSVRPADAPSAERHAYPRPGKLTPIQIRIRARVRESLNPGRYVPGATADPFASICRRS